MNFLSRNLMFLDIMGKPGKLLSYFDYNVREINIFVQNPIFLLFNSAEPESTAKETPRALKMMKLVLLVVILSFSGVFAQNPEIAANLIMMHPCNSQCLTEWNKCKEYYNCSGRRQASADRRRCFEYCTDEYHSCMECKI